MLVDSSAWIAFLRGDRDAVDRIDPLLAEDRAAITPMIAAEVTSGARTRALFDELTTRFAALPSLAEPTRVWPRIAELRFSLARRGFQTHLVDLAIALTAADARHTVITRDRDFERIAPAIGLEIVVF
ncbi:PIN domain-containing protein [Candidatus Binatia bacterium]|nr:PIN domain-containing protein [Candidatus Binatia bacterium]